VHGLALLSLSSNAFRTTSATGYTAIFSISTQTLKSLQRIWACDGFANELAQFLYRTWVFSMHRADDFHHFLHVGVLGLGVQPARYLKRIVLELVPAT
jgi:hypothetical protein